MSNPIEKMGALMSSLPEKDVPLGHKFLKERDFEALRDLVDSAVYKVKKNMNSECPEDRYLNVDFKSLMGLKAEVDAYAMCLELIEESVCGDFDDEEDYY